MTRLHWLLCLNRSVHDDQSAIFAQIKSTRFSTSFNWRSLTLLFVATRSTLLFLSDLSELLGQFAFISSHGKRSSASEHGKRDWWTAQYFLVAINSGVGTQNILGECTVLPVAIIASVCFQ